MQIPAQNIEDYLSEVPDDRKEPFGKLFQTISDNLPHGFQACPMYGMVGWCVPLEAYPAGYHCTPGEPLPFMQIASQKNFIAIYHMGIYADPSLLDWFVAEYPKHCRRKLDMGKSCIRFKKPDEIPFQLIAELARKMTPQQWVAMYEEQFKK